MAAMIRFFCHPGAGADGDLAYSYLKAIEAAGVPVRAIPIFGVDLTDDENARWDDAGALFTTPIQGGYVNVVCARAGMLWGMSNAADLSRVEDLPPELALGPAMPRKPRATPSEVYDQQKTAFSGLFTVGCKNVAILVSVPPPDAKEARALLLYDLVMCPTAADALALTLLGVKAAYLPPRTDLMRRMVEALCSDSGTTATTVASLATDVLLEITSSPFTVPEEWRFRSSTSGATTSAGDLPVPSPATGSSTGSSPRWTTASVLRRMWRWCMRRPRR